MEFFANSRAHLLAELERLDLLIRSRVALARKLQVADEQFRGLYISEQEVDALLHKPHGSPQWLLSNQAAPSELSTALSRLNADIDVRKQASVSRGIELRLDMVRRLFELSQFEQDALLVCIAVELDLRYDRLFAYLQDDVTKKKPSIDLILNLLLHSIDDRLAARHYFSPSAAVIQNRLVEIFEDPAQPRSPLLAKYLKADDRIVRYLLDSNELDDRIQHCVKKLEPETQLDEVLLDAEIKCRLKALVLDVSRKGRFVVHLRGPYGVGKQCTAAAVCHETGMQLLVVDLGRLISDGDSGLRNMLMLIDREARLQQAAIYWKGFDVLLAEEQRGALASVIDSFESSYSIVFVAGELPWEPGNALRRRDFFSVVLPVPTFAERASMWRAALDGMECEALAAELTALSNKFKLTSGQIRDAVATARNRARWRDAQAPQMTVHDLYDASRSHSNQKLATLARKITPRYKWSDIVLPTDRVAQLREICNHMKYRDRVYGEWGFDRRMSLGKGLAVLFAGPSGTGKTMAAEIIAGELGLDLYKIDLSTVVSKYIGETEKNLARIFSEAETSNAILFFDEADALFGKRSEVRDSHDRYANIETGYLLQRMEEYEGVAILATNLRKNMDDAFVRRLQFTVEFPFPDGEDRFRIWDSIWPKETPTDPDLDLAFMARRFEISGGNIRNIALAAAFIAADDGGTVQMRHIMVATQREYQKMGKLMTEGQFVASVRP